jgi:xylulokinase
MALLGIDLGTSSVKAVVIDENGAVLGSGMHEYPILTPRVGWAEQEPEAWWRSTSIAVLEATTRADERRISAIGLSGQMHGLVPINALLEPTAPAIIWADQRSKDEVPRIRELVDDTLLRQVGTLPAAGFYVTTMLWMMRHQPDLLERAVACILPKDYIRLRLTNQIATDASDASATGLFDIRNRRWSTEIASKLGLPAHLLPNVLESAQIAGTLSPAAAAVLNLTPDIPVVAGCADQVAQAVGNGLVEPGRGSITIGTGGQLFAPLDAPRTDDQLRLHTFCHAPADRWYLLGATLSAGLSLRWFRNLLGEDGNPDAYQQLASLANEVPIGADGLLFLPYLVGERAPVMDASAQGALVGLALRHERGHIARAIMEGVVFGLRQVLDIMDSLTAAPHILLASGNGLASPIWRQIAADILNRPLSMSSGGERAGIGAALIAGIGTGVYSDYAEVLSMAPRTVLTINPDPERVHQYDEFYARYQQLYPLLKTLH